MFDLRWFDLATMLLSVVGFLQLAGAAIERHKYGSRKVSTKGWIFILASLSLRFVMGGQGGGLALLAAARDLGVGLLIGSTYKGLEGAPARRGLVVAIILLGSWAACHHFKTPDDAGGDAEVAELLLELGPDDVIEEVAPVLEGHGATWERAFPTVDLTEDVDLAQYFLVRVSADRLEALTAALVADTENVDSAERNDPVQAIPNEPGEAVARETAQAITDDPMLGSQWGLDASRATDALPALFSASPTRVATVAILDTGVDAEHEDLSQVFEKSPAPKDRHGHGTHCAGIAGAVANNGLGMASLNFEGRFVRITGYPALSAGGWGTNESIAQAMIDAVDDGADVLSLSLGGYDTTPPKVFVDAVEYAHQHNVPVVVAAGNDDEDAKVHSPANVPGVIVVAALNQTGRKASFSNTNTSLGQPIAAPGVDILSLKTGGDYIAYSGTSMATPLVAGLVGVIRSLDPSLSPARVYEILRESGTEGADASRVGRSIDVQQALLVVLQ